MILDKDWNTKKHESLTEALTTREIEALYGLPTNRVLQDIRRGKVREEHYRQSGKVWLVSRLECNRLYSNYKPQQKRNDNEQVS